MGIKYQMTREGMQSLYTLAWQQRRARLPKADPMFSGYGIDQTLDDRETEITSADAELLEATIVSPGRVAPLEETMRSTNQRERLLSNRVLDLLRLGYTGF